MRKVEFFLPGLVPNKKDNYLPRRQGSKGKGLCIPPEIKRQLDAIQLMIQGEWHGAPPLTQASVSFDFHLAHDRHDLDGMATTLQDCLVQARVLVDDSAAHVSENHNTYRLVSKRAEGVQVSIVGDLHLPVRGSEGK